MAIMTLEQFAATGRDIADLETIMEGQGLEGVPGRAYTDHNLWIERWEDDRFGKGPPNGEPTWLLTLHNDQFEGDLATLEPLLYQWAIDEEIICGERHVGRDTGRGVCSNCGSAM